MIYIKIKIKYLVDPPEDAPMCWTLDFGPFIKKNKSITYFIPNNYFHIWYGFSFNKISHLPSKYKTVAYKDWILNLGLVQIHKWVQILN